MSNDQELETKLLASPEPALMGVIDIVEAFTALRHEIKLQVRGGRELQQSLQELPQRIEQRVTQLANSQTESATNNPSSSDMATVEECRRLAEAIAEVEENLCRVVNAMNFSGKNSRSDSSGTRMAMLHDFDQATTKAPWWLRMFGSGWLEQLRSKLAHDLCSGSTSGSSATIERGLELLLSRVHRLMEKCKVQRVDVLHQPFDPERMRALDAIQAPPDVPASHVAEQISPLYLWRNQVLRCADVRVAK